MRRAAALAAAAVLASGSAAAASWTASGSGAASARAADLGAGGTPTATATGRRVEVAWPATSFADGTVASGYLLRRYAVATGGSPAATIACPATACEEDAVPPGTWHYGVTPVYATWAGAEGPRSSAAVAAPSLTLAPVTFSSLPATLSGTVAGFVDGESLTFRLDDAATGAVLAATLGGTPTSAVPPPTVPAGGSAAVTVTVPSGTAAGAHTIYAVGSQQAATPAAGAAVTYDPAATLVVSPTSVGAFPATLTAGVDHLGAGDTVTLRLDDATAGTALGTATAGGTGAASNVSLALGCATPGTHTVYASGSPSGRSASATVTVGASLCPLSLVVTNKVGGTAGLAEQGDAVVVDFSAALSTTSLCASFTGPTLSGATVRIVDGGASADSVVVDGPTGQGGCTMRFGTLGLGGSGFNPVANKDVRFDASTLAWDGAARRLTVTLGPRCTTGSCATPVTVAGSTTATYTPHAALTTTGGAAVSGTASRTGVQF